MYYDGELINKAIENLKNADSYLKNADNYTGKNLVDDCQAISDSLNSKKNKISGLAITAEELGTFNKNVISSNNDKENDENYYKFDGNFDFLEEKIEKSKDEDLMENYMFQIYIQQMLNTSELNEEEQIIAQKYIDSGNNSALLYFLMVKETENNIKSLENEREKFHEMKISDFINMLKENGSIPEDYKLNINGDLTVFYIRENGADLQTLIGNEIINLIHDYDLRYLQEIQKLKQEKYTYKQELKKAEYALEFEKEYKILPIPQEQMKLIETFLNDYIKRFDTYNNSESFLEMLNYFNITNDEKINPYNLLLYLQVFPESLSTYLNIRDQMNVKIPNINSTTDLIDFLELNGIITFGLDEAGLYPQFEAYKYLEPEVLCVYQNILYNEGEEAASKFLEVYQDDINKAKGYEQAIECINSLLENKTDFQTVVQSLGIGTKDGIMAYFDGWAKIFDKEGLMTVNDYRTQFFMQLLLSSESIDKNELEKSLTNGDITASEYNTQMSIVDWSLKSDNLKSWCSTFYSVGMSVGQQIPSLAFSYLTMGIGSSIGLTGGALTKAAKMAYSISMFGSQFGTEKSNAIRKGSSQEIAFLYALMKAGSETAVENLFQIPGIPEEGLIKINGTDSKLMKIIKLIGSNFIEKPAGEIVEELIQNVIEGEIEYGFYAEEYTFSEWINSLSDTAITTYISTLILGANGIISDVANIKKGIIIKFSDNTEISFTPNQLQHLCEKSGLEISDGQITNVDTKTFKQEINNHLNSLSPEQRTEVDDIPKPLLEIFEKHKLINNGYVNSDIYSATLAFFEKNGFDQDKLHNYYESIFADVKNEMKKSMNIENDISGLSPSEQDEYYESVLALGKNKKLYEAKLGKSLSEATKVLDIIYNLGTVGYFKPNDVLAAKLEQNSGAYKIEINGVDYTKYFPYFDDFYTEKGVLAITCKQTGLQASSLEDLAIQLKTRSESGNPVTVTGRIFQNASSGANNFVKFGGNIGRNGAVEQCGAFFLTESPENIAKRFSDCCHYDSKTNDIIVDDYEKFGEKPLGGVPLSGKDGIFQIQVVVPVNNETLSCPSVNNLSAYIAYFAPGATTSGGMSEMVMKGCSIPTENNIIKVVSDNDRIYVGGEDKHFFEFENGIKLTIRHMK